MSDNSYTHTRTHAHTHTRTHTHTHTHPNTLLDSTQRHALTHTHTHTHTHTLVYQSPLAAVGTRPALSQQQVLTSQRTRPEQHRAEGTGRASPEQHQRDFKGVGCTLGGNSEDAQMAWVLRAMSVCVCVCV